jgi:hypothetical protein
MKFGVVDQGHLKRNKRVFCGHLTAVTTVRNEQPFAFEQAEISISAAPS